MSSTSKKSNTAIPSKNRQRRIPKKKGDWFLDQADVAKGAIKNTAVGMFKNLIKTLKVQDWAREYPIKTTSVAAVIGFFVGEKVTEVYGESKSPGIEIEARPAKPESIPAKVPSKTSAFSEISSVLLVKGADLLKDLAYTWFVQEVLPKQKKQREAVDSLAENLDAGHKEE